MPTRFGEILGVGGGNWKSWKTHTVERSGWKLLGEAFGSSNLVVSAIWALGSCLYIQSVKRFFFIISTWILKEVQSHFCLADFWTAAVVSYCPSFQQVFHFRIILPKAGSVTKELLTPLLRFYYKYGKSWVLPTILARLFCQVPS